MTIIDGLFLPEMGANNFNLQDEDDLIRTGWTAVIGHRVVRVPNLSSHTDDYAVCLSLVMKFGATLHRFDFASAIAWSGFWGDAPVEPHSVNTPTYADVFSEVLSEHCTLRLAQSSNKETRSVNVTLLVRMLALKLQLVAGEYPSLASCFRLR